MNNLKRSYFEILPYEGGYSVDRTVGNTDGLGGLFGILHALGCKSIVPAILQALSNDQCVL